MASSVNMVDELESSFQNCIALVTSQEQSNVTVESDELRTSMEQCMTRFLDASRQLDSFFVQKRLLLNKYRPEPSGKEDVAELKAELQRKDILLQRHNEKLQHWQAVLSGRGGTPVGGSPSSAAPPAGTTPSVQPSGTPLPVAPMPSQMGVSTPTGAPSFGGHLAYLEQTTSSIGSISSRGGS